MHVGVPERLLRCFPGDTGEDCAGDEDCAGPAMPRQLPSSERAEFNWRDGRRLEGNVIRGHLLPGKA